MLETPKGVRLHIGLFGRRNSGKSTLMNALIGQSISIVSDQPGTTTDPVEKTMELSPLGPVVFVDTAAAKQCGRAFIAGSGVDAVHLFYLAEGKHFDQLTSIGAKRADLRNSGGDMTTDQRPILGQLGMG